MSPRRSRQRRQARRQERGPAAGGPAAAQPARYRMREKLVSFGDDFVIENAAGAPAYRVDGKALRMRNTIKLQTPNRQPLYTVQERMLRLKSTMVIEKQGRTLATIQKALVTPLRDRFDVDVVGGPPLHVQGNIVDHEYTITRNGAVVARVSKRWFRVRDTYGVEVMPGEDDPFVLAVTAAIDAM